MRNRREMKTCAKQVLKKHYWLLLVVCLIGAVSGTEFSGIGFVRYNESVQNVLPVQDGVSFLKDVGSSPVFGRQRGVFAMVLNSITSGSFLNKIRLGVSGIIGSEDGATVFFIVLGLLFFLFLYIYGQAVYIVITRRIFLEARTYETVRFHKFLFLMRVRRWSRTAWNMLVLSVFQLLWDLTVIGGIVKHYSYFLVPYILAENPDMKSRDAINLSRRMMRGHKWECFGLELTFLLWDVLGLCTLGLSDIFFTNPYKTAVFGEYYAELRGLARKNQIPGNAALNDKYLFLKPEREELEAAYWDVLGRVYESVPEPKLSGVQGILSRWFGIVLTNSKEETAREKAQAERIKLWKYREVLEGRTYPGRLFPIHSVERRENLETIRYARNYSVASLILLFFSCSVIGWVWEVSLHLVTDAAFVNRGVLHGPWLPIYGSGSVLILVLLKRLRYRPVLEFVSAILLCGCVEYATSWYLELANGKKWWDYSGYFLNLNGRICAEGLLVFGLGGMAIVYIVAPLLDNLFRKLPRRVIVPLCIVLLLFYGIDQAYSIKHPNTGKGITSYEVEGEAQTEKTRNFT